MVRPFQNKIPHSKQFLVEARPWGLLDAGNIFDIAIVLSPAGAGYSRIAWLIGVISVWEGTLVVMPRALKYGYDCYGGDSEQNLPSISNISRTKS